MRIHIANLLCMFDQVSLSRLLACKNVEIVLKESNAFVNPINNTIKPYLLITIHYYMIYFVF